MAASIPPSADQLLSQAADDEHTVVATDPTGRYERFNKCLGMGAYKKVYLAFDQEEGVEVAWNELRIDHLQVQDVTKVLSEVRILQSLRHESIINLYHCWIGKEANGREQVYFVTELMTSGTLKSYIRKTKGLIKPKIIKNWARQILKGLEYLHSRDPPIIHRDLKCENIFINGNNGQAKIGDLGLATVKQRDFVSSVLGTPEFMAPELYDEKYDEKVDVYAFGMCVMEMVTKEYPYNECSNQAQIYRKVTSNIKPAVLETVGDPGVKSFIELCIEFEPSKRPSATQLLSHPFFNELDSNTANSQQQQMNALLQLGESPLSSLNNSVGALTSTDHQLLSTGSQTFTSNTTTTNTSLTTNSNIISVQVLSVEYPVIVIKMICQSNEATEALFTPGTSQSVGSGQQQLKKQEVKFPYHLQNDTAEAVVDEMVREGVLPPADRDFAVDRINGIVKAVQSQNITTTIPNTVVDTTMTAIQHPAVERHQQLSRVRSLSFDASNTSNSNSEDALINAGKHYRALSERTQVTGTLKRSRSFSSSQQEPTRVATTSQPIEQPNTVTTADTSTTTTDTQQQQSHQHQLSHYEKALEEKTNEIIEGVYKSQFRRGVSSSSATSAASSVTTATTNTDTQQQQHQPLSRNSSLAASETSNSVRPLSVASELSVTGTTRSSAELSIYVSEGSLGSRIGLQPITAAPMRNNSVPLESLFTSNTHNTVNQPPHTAPATTTTTSVTTSVTTSANSANNANNSKGLSAAAEEQLKQLQNLALSGFEKELQQSLQIKQPQKTLGELQQQQQQSSTFAFPSLQPSLQPTLQPSSLQTQVAQVTQVQSISLPSSPVSLLPATIIPPPQLPIDGQPHDDPFNMDTSRSRSSSGVHLRSASLAIGSSAQMQQQLVGHNTTTPVNALDSLRIAQQQNESSNNKS